MIVVRGPWATKPDSFLPAVAANLRGGKATGVTASAHATRVPEVTLDYACTSVADIVDHGDGSCTCSVVSGSEGAIVSNQKYTVQQ